VRKLVIHLQRHLKSEYLNLHKSMETSMLIPFMNPRSTIQNLHMSLEGSWSGQDQCFRTEIIAWPHFCRIVSHCHFKIKTRNYQMFFTTILINDRVQVKCLPRHQRLCTFSEDLEFKSPLRPGKKNEKVQ
jgi:hypothetical protein